MPPRAAFRCPRTGRYTAREGARTIDYAPPALNPPPSRRYYLYLMLPAIVVLAAISLYPFFWLVYMSLHNVELGAGERQVHRPQELRRVLAATRSSWTAGSCCSSTARCA